MAERPMFMQEASVRRLTGTERGTTYHRAMQLLDLNALKELDGRALAGAIRAQLEDCARRRLLTEVQREAVRPAMLARFLDGELGRRLRRAEELHREWPFNVMLRADEALTAEEAGKFGGEELLVQGSIDCCFLEGGEWVLLDYKTDRSDDLDALCAHYRKQLHVYALALERITGVRVRQRVLCLLASGVAVDV